MWLLALLACGSPISNQSLYEDALFAAALPSSERLGVPVDVRRARVGDSEVLERAVFATAELEDVLVALLLSGDALRSSAPTERTDVRRSWEAVNVVGDFAEARFEWWAQGEVVQPTNGGALTWTLALAAAPGGPYAPIGEGWHDPSGRGELSWDLREGAVALGLPDDPTLLTLHISYKDALPDDPESARSAEFTHGEELAATNYWAVSGDSVFGWTGEIGLVEDTPLPAATQLLHLPEVGGYATGVQYPADGSERPFSTCWDAHGDTLWLTGSGDTPAIGAEADCLVDNPF